MDHATYDLNRYLDSLEVRESDCEAKIKEIMQDEQFKKDLHDTCKMMYAEDPAQPKNIQAFNRVRNNLNRIAEQLLDGDLEEMESIQDVTILDLCAIELSKMDSIAENYAASRMGDYYES